MNWRATAGLCFIFVASVASAAGCSGTDTSTGSGGASATSSSVSSSSGSGGGGGAGGSGTSSSSASASASSSASSGSSSAASSSSSAGGGAPCGGGMCDCDADGLKAISCGGPDCNDQDPLVHPGQAMWFTTPVAGSAGDYDYDCNGKAEYQYTATLMCAGLAVTCDTTTVGWIGVVPVCGVAGQLGKCKVSGLNCVPDVAGMTIQGCH